MEITAEAIASLKKLRDNLKKWLKGYNELNDEEKQKAAPQLARYQKLFKEIEVSLSKAETKTIPSDDVSLLEQYYEECLELGIVVNTTASPEKVVAYKKAMEDFIATYEKASDSIQKKWLTAREEIAESFEALE